MRCLGSPYTLRLGVVHYELADSINIFKLAIVGTDLKLKELAKKLQDAQDKIHKHLQANYIWD